MYNPYQYGQGQAYYTADGQPIATGGQAAYPVNYAAPGAYPTQAAVPYVNNPPVVYGYNQAQPAAYNQAQPAAYNQAQPAAYNQAQPAAYSQAVPMYPQGTVPAAPMYQQGAVQAAPVYSQATVQTQVYSQAVPLYTQPAVHQQPGVSNFQRPYYGYTAEQPPPPAEATVYPNQVSVTNEQLEAVLNGCLVNQPANPDPRKFKLPKLLRTCQYELNESKMMDVRNFYHGPVELGEAIHRAAKKEFPCATYYLGLCYMQGEGPAQKPNLTLAQLWLDKAYAGSLDVTKRLAYRALIYRRLVVLRKIHDEEFAPMVLGPHRTLESIDLAAIFTTYRQHVTVKESDKQTPEVAWRSHLEEHRNMMCCVSTMFLALCYATGFGGAKNIQKAVGAMEELSQWAKSGELRTVPVVSVLITHLAAQDSRTASPATSRALSRSHSMDSESGLAAAKPATERPKVAGQLPVKPLAETLRATAKEFTPAPAARAPVHDDETADRGQPAPRTQEVSLRPWLASASERGESPGRTEPTDPSHDAAAITQVPQGADAYENSRPAPPGGEGEPHGTLDVGGATGMRSGKDAAVGEASERVPDAHPGTGLYIPRSAGQGNRHGTGAAIGATPFAVTDGFPGVAGEAPRRGPVAGRAPVPAWFTRGRSAGEDILSIVGQRVDTSEQLPPTSHLDPGDIEDKAADLQQALDDSESQRADTLQGRKGRAAALRAAAELEDASGSASVSSYDTGSSSPTRRSPRRRRRKRTKSKARAAGGGEEVEDLLEQNEQNPARAGTAQDMGPDELRLAVTNAMRQLTAAIEGKDRPALLDSVSLMSALLPQLADPGAMKADLDHINSAISQFEERQAEGVAAAAGHEVSPDTGAGQVTNPPNRTPPSAGPSGGKGPTDPSPTQEQVPLQRNASGPVLVEDPPVLPAGKSKPPPLKPTQQQLVTPPAGPVSPSNPAASLVAVAPQGTLPASRSPSPAPDGPTGQAAGTGPAGKAQNITLDPRASSAKPPGNPKDYLFPKERQEAAAPVSPVDGAQAEQPPLAAPPVQPPLAAPPMQNRVARAPAPPVPVREEFPPLAATARRPEPAVRPPVAVPIARAAMPSVAPPPGFAARRPAGPAPVLPPASTATNTTAASPAVARPMPGTTRVVVAGRPPPPPPLPPPARRPAILPSAGVIHADPLVDPNPRAPLRGPRPPGPAEGAARAGDAAAGGGPPRAGPGRAGDATAGGAPPHAGPSRAGPARPAVPAATPAPEAHAGPGRAGPARPVVPIATPAPEAHAGPARAVPARPPVPGPTPAPEAHAGLGRAVPARPPVPAATPAPEAHAGPGRAVPARPAVPAATPAPEASRMWANVAKAGAPAAKGAKAAEVAKPAGKANNLAQPTWDNRPVQAAQPGVQTAAPEPVTKGRLVEQLTEGHEWMRRFECPMSLDIFNEPCITAEGHTYERANIEEWLLKNDTSPSTNQPINKNVLYEDKYLKLILQKILAHKLQ